MVTKPAERGMKVNRPGKVFGLYFMFLKKSGIYNGGFGKDRALVSVFFLITDLYFLYIHLQYLMFV